MKGSVGWWLLWKGLWVPGCCVSAKLCGVCLCEAGSDDLEVLSCVWNSAELCGLCGFSVFVTVWAL